MNYSMRSYRNHVDDQSHKSHTYLPDLYSREDVTFAGFSAEVFSAAHFLDDKLLALFGAEDFGRHARAGHQRAAELCVARSAHGQHGIKRELLAGRQVAVVDDQLLAFFDFVLMIAVGNDCVHGRERIGKECVRVSARIEPFFATQVPRDQAPPKEGEGWW